MRKVLIPIFISLAVLSSFAQSNAGTSAPSQAAASDYQAGTIMEVKPHPVEDGNNASVTRYDVSVRVVNTDYVVLYTPRYGGNTVEYKRGMGVPVLVGIDTLTVRDLLGNKVEAPIISRKTLPAQRLP
jgi:hypothetical protein